MSFLLTTGEQKVLRISTVRVGSVLEFFAEGELLPPNQRLQIEITQSPEQQLLHTSRETVQLCRTGTNQIWSENRIMCFHQKENAEREPQKWTEEDEDRSWWMKVTLTLENCFVFTARRSRRETEASHCQYLL